MPAPPPSLAELQRAFAGAIVDGEAPELEPWIAARGIAPAARLRIYRHANFAIHVDALVTSYPALHRLLGADCFDGLATRHAAYHGSRSGNLQDYGADFAAFLDAQPEVAAWPWLGELARLEWLRQEAALAADEPSVDAATLLAALAATGHPLHLRPCVRVLVATYAVFDLWQRALAIEEEDANPATDPTHPQAVLLWREGGQVAMRVISPAQAAFVRALRHEASLDQALAAAQHVDAQMPAETLLRPLLEHALLAA